MIKHFLLDLHHFVVQATCFHASEEIHHNPAGLDTEEPLERAAFQWGCRVRLQNLPAFHLDRYLQLRAVRRYRSENADSRFDLLQSKPQSVDVPNGAGK